MIIVMIMMTNMTTVSTQKIEREIPSKKVNEKSWELSKKQQRFTDCRI